MKEVRLLKHPKRFGVVLDAEKIRIIPSDGSASVTEVVSNPKVVAMTPRGDVVYSVGVEDGKVVATFSDVTPKVVRVLLHDAYEVAVEVGDKRTARDIENFVRALIAKKFGVPVSLVKLKNVRAYLKNDKLSDEDVKEIRSFLMMLRSVALASKKSSKIASASSYQKGFVDAINLLEEAVAVEERVINFGEYKVEVDDELNVVAYEVGGKRVTLDKKVHLSEFDINRVASDEPIELEF